MTDSGDKKKRTAKTKRPALKADSQPPADGVEKKVPTKKQTQLALRKFVENFYDIQELRLQTGGRTKPKAEGAEIILFEEDLLRLERQMNDLEKAEKLALADVLSTLKRLPFYNTVLADKVRFRGIGPTMAGVILSSFDIEREDTPSKMWAFAGLAPVPAVRCKSCQDWLEPEENEGNAPQAWSHRRPRAPRPGGKAVEPRAKCPVAGRLALREDVFESGKSMRPVKGEKLRYNKWLRAKLCGVLGPVFLKLKSPWTKHYYDYKHRKETAGWGTGDAHRHAAAIRYMVKQLLAEIWREWRTAEGLPVRPSYHEAKQGHMHSGGTTPVAGTSGVRFGERIEPPVEPEVEAELALAEM